MSSPGAPATHGVCAPGAPSSRMNRGQDLAPWPPCGPRRGEGTRRSPKNRTGCPSRSPSGGRAHRQLPDLDVSFLTLEQNSFQNSLKRKNQADRGVRVQEPPAGTAPVASSVATDVGTDSRRSRGTDWGWLCEPRLPLPVREKRHKLPKGRPGTETARVAGQPHPAAPKEGRQAVSPERPFLPEKKDCQGQRATETPRAAGPKGVRGQPGPCLDTGASRLAREQRLPTRFAQPPRDASGNPNWSLTEPLVLPLDAQSSLQLGPASKGQGTRHPWALGGSAAEAKAWLKRAVKNGELEFPSWLSSEEPN